VVTIDDPPDGRPGDQSRGGSGDRSAGRPRGRSGEGRLTPRPALVLLRAVPWPAIGAITILALALGTAGVALAHSPTGPILLAVASALLAAAAAFALDEPASAVVDVTPTRPARVARVRAVALIPPATAAFLLITAMALRHPGLSTPAMGLAVLGNLLLGFAVAATARRRTGEPGPAAATTLALALIVLPRVGPISQHVQTFPTTVAAPDAVSSNVWWAAAGVTSLIVIATSLRRLARWAG